MVSTLWDEMKMKRKRKRKAKGYRRLRDRKSINL